MDKIFSVHLDANESAFFARQLEAVKAQVYEIEYPGLKATQVLPVDTSAGAGAKTIVWRMFDKVGMAKVIASYADDLPRVAIKATEHVAHIRSIGASYEYSTQDIRYAMRAGVPLAAQEAMAAREAIEQLIDEIAWFGDAEYNLQGFLYNANISSYVADDGAGGTTDWARKTAAEIIADVNNAIKFVKTSTRGVEQPNMVLLPTDQYATIATTPTGIEGTQTILSFLKAAHPGVTFDEVEKLANVSPAVVGGGDTSNVMVVYRKDPSKLTLDIPMPFTQYPPQPRNLSQVINCEARIAGVLTYKPLSVLVVEGI